MSNDLRQSEKQEHRWEATATETFLRIGSSNFSDDLLLGATNISKWMFGEEHRRKLYHLVETSRLPTFRLGSQIAAQKSVLLATFWAEQKAAFGSGDIEDLVRLRLLLVKTLELLGQDEIGAASQRDQAKRSLHAASSEIARFLRK